MNLTYNENPDKTDHAKLHIIKILQEKEKKMNYNKQ